MCTYHGDIRGHGWVLQIKLKSSGLALPTGSFFWPPLLRLLGHILSCSSVPIFVLLSGPLTLFEATKCHALPESGQEGLPEWDER